MRKTWIIAVAAAAVALAGCNREMDSPVAAPSDGLFRAAIEAPTRVALSDEGAFSWQAGDAVAVLTNDGIKPFALVEGAGSKVAAFDGSLGAATSATVAVYPASIAKDDNTVTLPAEYAWAEGQSNAAMYCNPVSLTGVNSFKHLGGILKIAYAEIPANADALVLTASAQITGDFTITDGVIAAGAGESQVKVTFAAGSNPAAFYIPVPTGEFNFSVELQAAGSPIADTQKGTSSPIKIDRRSLVLMDPITGPEPMTFTITTAEEFVQFLSEAPSYPEYDKAVLGNDIDLAGVDITPAASFAGTFDGAGKSLKNISLSNGIFANLSGTVKDLKMENGALNYTSTFPDMTGFAFIASKSTGTVKDCDVNGAIKINAPGKDESGTKARIYVAGLVGECTTGLVEGCKFSGSIDVELTELSRSISSIGGVVSRAGKKGQTGKVIVKDCVNEASIKFKFSGASGGMQKFGIGGVVGQTPSNSGVKGDDNFDCGIIENITNYGNIEWEYPAGGSGSYPVLGGAVGAVEGELHGAKNYGNLKYTGSLTTAVTDASIGGVAGYVTGDASDCHNYGTITLDAAFAGGTALAQNGGNTDWSTFGGVFGNVGQFIKTSTLSSKPSSVENLSNNAELILTPKMQQSGGPRMCIAGVVGASTANLKDIVNNSPITIQTQTKSAYVSGCVGYLAGNLEHGVNNAAVVVDGLKDEVPSATNSEQFWFGGVVGYIIKGSELANCENHGDLTLQNVYTTPTLLSYMGGVNGAYSGGFTITDSFNDGAILDKAENPICLGGVSGSFNGQMTGCYNAGTVTYEPTYVSGEAGKEPEVGGIAGYVNGSMTDVASKGAVVANAGFAGGIAGGAGQDLTNGLLWKATDVDCSVTSAGTAAAVLARFREEGTTVLTLGAENEPVRVTDVLDALPLCAELKGNSIAEVNVIRGKILPMEIASVKDFLTFVEKAKQYDPASEVKLTENIELPSSFVPDTLWCNFNGDGHTVTYNLASDVAVADDPAAANLGLFRVVNGTVKDLKVAGTLTCTAPSGTYHIGGIAGMSAENAVIENCENYVEILATTKLTHHMGGILGFSSKGTVFRNCRNAGPVTMQLEGAANASQIGGIVGHLDHSATFENCVNDGELKYIGNGTARIAGMAGYLYGPQTISFKDCINNGDVTSVGFKASQYTYAAGISAYFQENAADPTKVEYIRCTNNGKITCNIGTGGDTAQTRAAGIVGHAGKSADITVQECTNNGEVTTDGTGSKTVIGGVIGFGESSGNVTCDGCVNAAPVKAASAAGGIVGGLVGQTQSATSTYTNFSIASGSDVEIKSGSVGAAIGKAAALTTAMTGKVAAVTVTKGEAATVLTAENYQDYVLGDPSLGEGGSKEGVVFDGGEEPTYPAPMELVTAGAQLDYTTLPGEWNVLGNNSTKNGIYVLGGTGSDPRLVCPYDKTWDWNDSVYRESDNGLTIELTGLNIPNIEGNMNWWNGADGKWWDYVWAFQNAEKPEYIPFYGTNLSDFYNKIPRGKNAVSIDITTMTATLANGETPKILTPGVYKFCEGLSGQLLTVPDGCFALKFHLGNMQVKAGEWYGKDIDRFMMCPLEYIVIFEKEGGSTPPEEPGEAAPIVLETAGATFDIAGLPGSWNVLGNNSTKNGIFVLGGSGSDPRLVCPYDKTWDWNDTVYRESDNGLSVAVTGQEGTVVSGTMNWWNGADGKWWDYVWNFKSSADPTTYDPYMGTDLSKFYNKIPKGKYNFTFDLSTMTATLNNGEKPKILLPGVYKICDGDGNSQHLTVPDGCFAMQFHLGDMHKQQEAFYGKDIDRFMFYPLEYFIIFEKG